MLPLANSELGVLSVSEVSQQIKQNVELHFARVKVRGEISGLKKHSSGHTYFSLKDQGQDAVLNAICWRGTKTVVALEDGLEIVAIGRITTYPGRSNYQIIVSDAETTGQGALLKLLQERKQKLLAEGLFDKKRPLPKFPNTIGVVTSPTGAVIQDIIHRVSDRYPCRIILWPVAVQGADAAGEIAEAIRGFNSMLKPDVIIVARGGGSIEDLWPFNEECVVRAAFESEIPLISAVGHETDTTLIDYAADVRAPTPTAAAEMATPVLAQVLSDVDSLKLRLVRSLRQLSETMALRVQNYRLPRFEYILNQKELRVDDYSERLERGWRLCEDKNMRRLDHAKVRPPKGIIDAARGRLPLISNAMNQAFRTKFETKLVRFRNLAERLSQGSYQSTLERGFCLAMDNEGAPIKSVKRFEGEGVHTARIHFYDGSVNVQKT
jgi:exodeoxyribonuclease VII large subunit